MNSNGEYVVGLFGHYGNSNLGDESITRAAIQNLRDRIPNIQLKGLSINPLDTQKRFNIESFPIRYDKDYFQIKNSGKEYTDNNSRNSVSGLRQFIKKIILKILLNSPTVFGFLHLLKNIRTEINFLHKVRAQLAQMDILIICGSNQLGDSRGPWGFPYTLLKWVFLAKSKNTDVFVVSVGAGPLSYSLSYWMLKKMINYVDYLSFRDHGSKKLMEEHLYDIKGEVFPDLAHSLKTIPYSTSTEKNATLVAVNPMPVFDSRYWYKEKKEKYDNYVHNLAQLLKHLLQKQFSVKLFNNHPADVLVIKDLLNEFQQISKLNVNKINVVNNSSTRDLVDTISGADIIVATRFHATILPLRFGVPVLGVCYHRKSREFLEDVGLEDYSVDLNSFTDKELCSKFDSLYANIGTTRNNLKNHFNRYKKSVDKQWDHLADLVQAKDSNEKVGIPVARM